MKTHLLLGIGSVLLLVGCKADTDTFGQGGSQNDYVPDGDDSGSTGDDGGTDTAGGSDTGSAGDDTGGSGDDGGDTGGSDTGGPVIEGTGYGAGDVAYDLEGTDQGGDDFSLHDLYGRDVIMVVGHMDDPGVQAMAGWIGDFSGVSSVLVVGRDENSVTADESDAAGWAATYGIDRVVVDPTGELVNTWAERNPPKTYVIDDDMEIYWTMFGTVDRVQAEDKLDDID